MPVITLEMKLPEIVTNLNENEKEALVGIQNEDGCTIDQPWSPLEHYVMAREP